MEKESALWRKVDEKERVEILRQAKTIMDNFSNALASVEKQTKETLVEQGDGYREEAEEKSGENSGESESDFRELFFKNVPKKEKDCVVAEKGEWVK